MRLNGLEIVKNVMNRYWTLTNTTDQYLAYSYARTPDIIWVNDLFSGESDKIFIQPLLYAEFGSKYDEINWDCIRNASVAANNFVKEMELCG